MSFFRSSPNLVWAAAALSVLLLLSGCAPATAVIPTSTNPPVVATGTSHVVMLPTWTPSITPSPKPSLTPRPTITPLATSPATALAPATKGVLIDRPTYALLVQPANLVTMQYDPAIWSLSTSYPTSNMAYALTNRADFGCKLDPAVVKDGQAYGAEGYELEQYTKNLGSTRFMVSRLSKAGMLEFANYCYGEGENATCYVVTPGNDHAACTAAAETVLSTFALIANPFLDPLVSAPNHWECINEASVNGRCSISYSIPLNALAYTSNGEGWAAGDDGVIYHLSNAAWSQATSPSTQSIYDMSFSSPSDGWAVGKGAQVLRWDGKEWKEVLPYHAPGEGPGGSTQVLYGVEATSADNAWMVGMIKDISGKNSPYAIHWNGTDLLEESTFPDCGGCGLNAVLSLGAKDVFAVGGSSLGAVAMHWDGTTWTSTQIAGADALYTLEKAPDGTLWAAGIETARDQSSTRGALFHFDGQTWQRLALPPLTGGIYSLAILPTGQVAIGGDLTALWTGSEWQPILAGLAGYGWITDIETDSTGVTWALTRSGNLFRLSVGK